ncbi:MAG: site-2 protease family protein [candidate division WOR-3 bacterium]|nr:site-2 protease family protein [candidate division WOR-3 bacterium]
MDDLHTRIENFLNEVMEIKSNELEHFKLVWSGKFLIDENRAIKYVKEKADSLDLLPMFKKYGEIVKIAFIPEREKTKSKRWVNLALLFATFGTTLAAGALQQGLNPVFPISNLLRGLPFSIAIMLILGSHELGHYFAAKRNGVEATLPYFIPAPHLIGTFGAVIIMRSPIADRNSLVEIGAAGPIVGFILSTFALLIGFSLSKVITVPSTEGLILGDSILTHLLTKLYFPMIPEGREVFLHPIGFAGWIGYFVTAMNLLPVGQLDGGHISYALIEEKHRFIGYIAFGAILILSFLWLGWLIWGALLFVIGFRHPPPLDSISNLTPKNQMIGYISLLIFILTFIPRPIQIG